MQQGQTLTLTRSYAGGPVTIAYALDGSETTSRLPGRLCEPDSQAAWTATWNGNALVLAMVKSIAPNGKTTSTDVKTTMRLETSNRLHVDVASRTGILSTTYARTTPDSADAATTITKARATMAQIAWISGVWIGRSGGSTLEERWTPAAGGSMMAVSRTIRDGVMAAFEFLCIVERDGGLVYQAMPNGRMPATDFTLTKIDADSALFENPAHDFPKMIRYAKRPDGSLEATIAGEGGQKPQTFLFKRQE
jgi:hypothetical protein